MRRTGLRVVAQGLFNLPAFRSSTMHQPPQGTSSQAVGGIAFFELDQGRLDGRFRFAVRPRQPCVRSTSLKKGDCHDPAVGVAEGEGGVYDTGPNVPNFFSGANVRL
jgi:hypothetical protein